MSTYTTITSQSCNTNTISITDMTSNTNSNTNIVKARLYSHEDPRQVDVHKKIAH